MLQQLTPPPPPSRPRHWGSRSSWGAVRSVQCCVFGECCDACCVCFCCRTNNSPAVCRLLPSPSSISSWSRMKLSTSSEEKFLGSTMYLLMKLMGLCRLSYSRSCVGQRAQSSSTTSTTTHTRSSSVWTDQTATPNSYPATSSHMPSVNRLCMHKGHVGDSRQGLLLP